MMENKEFSYTYKAPTESERREIASIRRQYQPREYSESKLDKLRRLDARVKNSAVIISLVLGVVGILVFGLGLTMVIEWGQTVIGIAVMIFGTIPAAIAYPVYRAVIEMNKKKYGPQILKLSEELLGEEEK